GVSLTSIAGFAFDDAGFMITGQTETRAVLSVDPTSGNRSLLSSGSNSSLGQRGMGIVLSAPNDIAIVPVPEPASIATFLMGLVVLLVYPAPLYRTDATTRWGTLTGGKKGSN